MKIFMTLALLSAQTILAQTALAQPTTLTVVTHDSFDLDKKLIAGFEAANKVKVRLIKAGDAGELLNRLILTRASPLGDVVYGLDNTLLPRAAAAGLLSPYRSPNAARIPAAQRLGDGTLLNTVDLGYVAFNYDKAYFQKAKLALPTTLAELSQPQYAKLTVVESPATSSPGLAFLLALNSELGDSGALNWYRTARTNGMKVTRGWSDAYYKEFSLNKGKYPIVLSYASSPAAEVFYSGGKLTQPPTAVLDLPGSTFVQLEGVGILKGTRQAALAKKFVDFMLSAPVQADFPTRMFVYPSVPGTPLDPVFKFAQKPDLKPAGSAVLGRAQALTDAWINEVLRK
jgi:thiamine transport system substrate-binding protein